MGNEALIGWAETACLTLETGGTAPARRIIRDLAAALKAAEDKILALDTIANDEIAKRKAAESERNVALNNSRSVWKDMCHMMEKQRDEWAAKAKQAEADLAAARAEIERLTGLRDQWQEAAGNWQDRAEKAEAENDRLREGLRKIANPSTVAGMHDEDRASKLQTMASALLDQAGKESDHG
jgi:hypothetical protein